jgi:hypothetical protein
MVHRIPAKAYTPWQIAIAACLGGPLAGAWLLVQTQQVLRKEGNTSEYWLTACVALGFILTLFALLPVNLRIALAGLPALASGIGCGVWAIRARRAPSPIGLDLAGQLGTWEGAMVRGMMIGLLSLSALGALFFLSQFVR